MTYDHPGSYIKFYPPHEPNRGNYRQLVEHMYFDANLAPNLKVFEAPGDAGHSSINIGVKGSQKHITITFINQDLLKM